MNAKTKTASKLFLGILSVITTIVAVYILLHEIGVRNLTLLRWIPLLTSFMGFYIAGLINRKTKLALTPVLLLALLILAPFRLFHFPLLFLIILFSSLGIIITRREIRGKLKTPALLLFLFVFGYHLFAQPFIIQNEGYGMDMDNNLYNATVLWDFTSNTPSNLPNEIFADENGNEISLTEFKDKTLYVTFWSTSCGPCLSEKPALEKLKTQFKDSSQIIFVDISTDADVSKWKSFLAKHKSSGIQLISKDNGETMSNFQFTGIPHHIITEPGGNYKICHGPELMNNELLSKPAQLTEYINTPYKVFRIIQKNEKDTTIRVR